MIFNFISSLVAIVPSILLIVELILYKDVLDVKILSLTVTNFTGLLPTSLCLYYIYTKQANMFIEMIPFAMIVLSSGTYHLCNEIQNEVSFCSQISQYAFYADFINSYYCIITVILYAIKFEFFMGNDLAVFIRRILYILNFIFYFFIIIFQSNIFIPLIYTLSMSCIAFIVIYIKVYEYKNLFTYENKLTSLCVGITLALFSFFIYIFTVYFSIQENGNYWILHSFCWHIPIMTSSMFILEACVDKSNHRPFTIYIINIIRCYNNGRYSITEYISSNNLGIELTIVHESKSEDYKMIEDDESNYV